MRGSEPAPHALLLSPHATFLTSFFGGPLAAVLIGSVNLRRLGRLRQDGWLVALGAAAALAGLVVSALVVANLALAQELLGGFGRPGTVVRRGLNLLGFLVWVVFHRRLRPELSAARLSPLGFDRPWKVALSCIGVTVLVHAVVIFGSFLLFWSPTPGAH